MHQPVSARRLLTALAICLGSGGLLALLLSAPLIGEAGAEPLAPAPFADRQAPAKEDKAAKALGDKEAAPPAKKPPRKARTVRKLLPQEDMGGY